MNWLKKLFGTKATVDFKQLQQNGAIIIDVRSPDEFRSGHIKGSINIPLHSITKETARIRKMNKPVITCCLSGGRSSVAKRMLTQAGIEVYNGGGWAGLRSKIS
ncbi:MAG: rhodanese-like domain-containing protein [Chitinophagaceae bacterium]|nr:rhodanese-like domain-containing protein [Chitinophagaceae bacterium]